MKLVDSKMLVLIMLLDKEIDHTSYDLYAISGADHYAFEYSGYQSRDSIHPR